MRLALAEACLPRQRSLLEVSVGFRNLRDPQEALLLRTETDGLHPTGKPVRPFHPPRRDSGRSPGLGFLSAAAEP
jgi:hypothetical protein